MIAVFGEFGGDLLLGKAREIADLAGDRVVAIVRKREEEEEEGGDSAQQRSRMISLGADEVLTARIEDVGEWPEAISSFIKKSGEKITLFLFASNPCSNAVMGACYASLPKGTVSSYLDDAQFSSTGGLELSKPLYLPGGEEGELSLRLSIERPTVLASIKLSSVPPAFQDETRYGKLRELESSDGHPGTSEQVRAQNKTRLFAKRFGKAAPETLRYSSQTLTILIPQGAGERVAELSRRLAEKTQGRVEELSQAIEIVYGPCILIEVYANVRDLPEFRGEVITMSKKRTPASSIADIAVEYPDIELVLENLLLSL